MHGRAWHSLLKWAPHVPCGLEDCQRRGIRPPHSRPPCLQGWALAPTAAPRSSRAGWTRSRAWRVSGTAARRSVPAALQGEEAVPALVHAAGSTNFLSTAQHDLLSCMVSPAHLALQSLPAPAR